MIEVRLQVWCDRRGKNCEIFKKFWANRKDRPPGLPAGWRSALSPDGMSKVHLCRKCGKKRDKERGER